MKSITGFLSTRGSVSAFFLPAFIFINVCTANVHAQDAKINLNVKNKTLKEALKEIESSSDFTFFYNDAAIDMNRKVTVRADNQKISSVLDRILTDCTYSIQDKTIILKPGLAGQEIPVEGTVKDENGEPVTGAGVILKNSPSRGTITDADGQFSLRAPAGAVLVVSYLGYLKQEVLVSSQKPLDVNLVPDSKTLDEVIVVGYGTQKKRDLTGAVASIRGDELPRTANTTLGQMLKSQVPGLSYTQTSNQPGAAVWMQIRGAAAGASPLVVIDGIPVSTMWEPDPGLNFGKGDKESVLDNINPDDVLDIQVLKDASATSIYGSRAAGGVILISTKRGAEDGKLDINFKSSYSTQWIAEKPEVMGPEDYMRASNDSQLERWMKDEGYYPWGTRLPSEDISEMRRRYEAAGKTWNYAQDEIDRFTGGTDWYDAITRRGEIQEYSLSITGGTKKSSYLISLGYMGNEGIVKNNDYARTSGRMNFDQTFSKYLKGGVSAAYSLVKSGDVPLSGKSGSTTLFQSARRYDPTIPVRDENGNYALGRIYGLSQNPVSIQEATMLTKKDNILTSAFLDIMPVDGLVLKATVGYDRKFATTGAYFPMTTQEGINSEGVAKINDNNLSNCYLNATATYNKTFAEDHALTLMAGWEYQEVVSENLSAENRKFPYDGVKWHNLGLGAYERPIVASGKSTTQNASFISRLNYAWKGRYLLTANFRRDGSSNFAANRQWGNFGGVSVAWRINDEAWMQSLDRLSNLKLRAGAGLTGYAGSLTGTLTYYASGNDYYFNNMQTSGVALAALGNPDLSWESQQDINIGLDFGFFNNKFGGSVDVYERKILDRIGTKNLMSFHEINTLNYNTQRIDNTRGLDLSLYGTVVQRNGFSWRSQFTLTYYRDFASRRDPSEILDINTPARNADWNDVWSYLSDGLVMPGETVPHMPGALPGTVKIRDLNGYLYDENGVMVRDADGRPQYLGEPDGKLDNADLVIIHNSTPIPFSWSNTFTYKDFDLNIYLYGKFNHYKNTDYLVNISYSPYEGTNTSPYFNDRFMLNNLTSSIPGFTYSTSSSYGYGDYFMEDAWFIRLENITLGYTLPRSVTKGLVQSVRFHASLKNILTLTPYKGYDPEYDVFTHPSTGAFTVGVNINF
jgi:TonB-linked SusC/RagA family outer membrane protein